MSIFEEHKNIFDILREADDDGSDIINGGDAAASDTGNDTSGGGEDASSSTTDDNAGDDNNGGDDDFNIDTSLGDEGDDSGEDGDTENTDTSSDLDSGSSSSTDSEEANPVNKDLFTTLTAEEQAIKIKEQKKKFNDMYNYIDELIGKVGDIDIEEDTIKIFTRISGNLYRLRDYLADYIISVFPRTDYFDNDVFFNRFLLVLYSIDTTLSDIADARAKKLGLNDDKIDKK